MLHQRTVNLLVRGGWIPMNAQKTTVILLVRGGRVPVNTTSDNCLSVSDSEK